MPRLPILALILLLGTWQPSVEGSYHRKGQKKCEQITIPLCKGIGYNMTSFPNGYGHEKQEEAGMEVHQFYPLVEVGCYKHLKFFLCSLYTPICQENYEMEVRPCREVCLEAKKRCAPIMQQYGFKWPETLFCDALPRAADQATTGEICAAPPDALAESSFEVLETSTKPKSRPAQPKPKSKTKPVSPSIIDLNIVDTQCECRCVRPFHVTVSSLDRVHNVTNCAYACRSPALARPADQQFMDSWIMVWAGVCLGLSIFTILTFCIEMSRFPYPERPIFFLAGCQAMVAIGFLIRVYVGSDNVACNGETLKTAAAPNGTCFAVFFLIYYFGMAAAAWWVILSLTWVLAAVPNWSTEWIGKYANYFHLFAWTLPALQTAAVVAFKAVDGDPLSGICYVGNTDISNLRLFVLGPLLVYFTIGCAFLSVGFLNLWSIRSSLKKTHPTIDRTGKLTQLMSKIGIFSVLYTLPVIFVILAQFYEQHYRPLWELSQLCPCSVQVQESRDTSTLLSLIKTASMLVVGWTTGVWVVSGKTLQSWKSLLCCCCPARRTTTQGYANAHGYQLSNDGIPYFPAPTEHGTMSRVGYMHHSNGTSPLSKFQSPPQNDIMYTNRECFSPLIYGATNSGGTLKHCLRGGMMPEDV